MSQIAEPCSWTGVFCYLTSGESYTFGGPYVPDPLVLLYLNDYGLSGVHPQVTRCVCILSPELLLTAACCRHN